MGGWGPAGLRVAVMMAWGCVAASAFDFGSFKTDNETDLWLKENSATYARIARDIQQRSDIRGYGFARNDKIPMGMMAVFRGDRLEIQLNPALSGAHRVTVLIFEMANASRAREHEHVDRATDEGIIRTPEEFGLAHEMLEYEALRIHRQILTEIESRAGPLPKEFFRFVSGPAPSSTADYRLPDLDQYLKTQKETGHTGHYYKFFHLRKAGQKRPSPVPGEARRPAAAPRAGPGQGAGGAAES